MSNHEIGWRSFDRAIFTRAIIAKCKRRIRMGRLKIHLPVDEQTVHFCRRVNAQIQRITDSAIVFSDTSLMIPHITLVLGKLVPSQTFEGLTKITQALAEQVKPLTLKLSQPYIDSRSYVVCAVQEDPTLIALRTSMRENIMGAYLTTRIPRFDITHLTLAHIDAQHEKVNAYLNLIQEIPQVVCTRVEISHIGPKGTCIDRLFATHLICDTL